MKNEDDIVRTVKNLTGNKGAPTFIILHSSFFIK